LRLGVLHVDTFCEPTSLDRDPNKDEEVGERGDRGEVAGDGVEDVDGDVCSKDEEELDSDTGGGRGLEEFGLCIYTVPRVSSTMFHPLSLFA
jgi:hypothetical protein